MCGSSLSGVDFTNGNYHYVLPVFVLHDHAGRQGVGAEESTQYVRGVEHDEAHPQVEKCENILGQARGFAHFFSS
jgi:hypothetical protein